MATLTVHRKVWFTSVFALLDLIICHICSNFLVVHECLVGLSHEHDVVDDITVFSINWFRVLYV